MPGEQTHDSRPVDALLRYRAEVYRLVIDQITTSIDERFTANKAIILDTACLDPRRFHELIKDGIPPNCLERIAQLTGLNASSLRTELSTFCRIYGTLCNTLQNEFNTEFEAELVNDNEYENSTDNLTDVQLGESDMATEEEALRYEESQFVKCSGACKQCLKCCYKVLHRYSLNASAFSNLYLAYQYLLTLSFSQVSCERAFSKMKIVKTRLRASLGNEKLETFMMMSTEKDILDAVTVDDLISIMARDSQVFSKLLLL